MNELTRRTILQQAALGVYALPGQGSDDPPQKVGKTDRDFVMEAGMTADEAECWELIAKAAGKFFELPQLHPMDKQEVASAIHIVQNKLLSRPTYRKYLESAKAGRK
jgi:hypothetical protein